MFAVPCYIVKSPATKTVDIILCNNTKSYIMMRLGDRVGSYTSQLILYCEKTRLWNGAIFLSNSLLLCVKIFSEYNWARCNYWIIIVCFLTFLCKM